MFQSCPISGETRNERVVRIVAALVLAIVLGALAAGSPWTQFVMLALAADFVVRGYYSPKRSLLATLARGAANALKLAPKPVDAAPKRFAARIGVAFSLATAALYIAGAPTAGAAVAIVLASCALLEAALGLCVGCKVYALLPHSLARTLAR